MKPNINLTIDRDFREKRSSNTDTINLEAIIAELGDDSVWIADTERATGILTGTKEEISKKEEYLAWERDRESSCDRCGAFLDNHRFETLCSRCDRELELEVLSEL